MKFVTYFRIVSFQSLFSVSERIYKGQDDESLVNVRINVETQLSKRTQQLPLWTTKSRIYKPMSEPEVHTISTIFSKVSATSPN